MCASTLNFCAFILQNKEKKHRTNLYAFTVTDLLDEWEDGKVMGKLKIKAR